MLQQMQFSVSEPAELKGKNADHLAMQADQDDTDTNDDQTQEPRRRMTREDIFGTHFTPEAS